jgi:hypothetical protein
MTPQHRTVLIAAIEAGDDVKAITLILQVIAQKAKAGEQDEATQIRKLLDEHRGNAGAVTAYRRLLLDIVPHFVKEHTVVGVATAIKVAEWVVVGCAFAPPPEQLLETLERVKQ